MGQAGVGEHHQDEGQAHLPDDAHHHQVDVVPEGLPEHPVGKELAIVGQPVEGHVGAALPLKEAVDDGAAQRVENREDKGYHRYEKIQQDGPGLGLDGLKHGSSSLSARDSAQTLPLIGKGRSAGYTDGTAPHVS